MRRSPLVRIVRNHDNMYKGKDVIVHKYEDDDFDQRLEKYS